MIDSHVRSLMGAGCLSLAAAGSAFAGGLERGGYNVDLLFDPGRFSSEVTATYVNPQRELDNVVDTDPSDGIGSNGIGGGATDGVRDTSSYWVPRLGLKGGFGENIDCMVDYSQPWGVHLNPGANWMGANSDIETKVNSDNYAGTCSYRFDAGKGQLRFIGGVFYQEIDGFKERLVAPVPTLTGTDLFGNGVGRLDLETNGVGWRIGAAYEIEEIAMRISLVYNSEVKLDDITGTLDLTQVPSALNPANPLLGVVTPVFGSSQMPQSLEMKMQSGIAPGWLAFGSVKWVDWSVLQTVAFCPVGTEALGCNYGAANFATSLDLLYRDGWTVSGGIGHAFTDQLSGAISLAWDRGTATGLGTQTDTWTLSGGAAYVPNKNVEFRLGGAVGVLTSGESTVQVDDNGNVFGSDITYSFGNDFVGALSGTVKVKF
jgi:long-chain fatty acid transport protein